MQTLRNIIYYIVGLVARIIPDNTSRIVVLCYHSISSDGWKYSVTLENIQKQIDIISKTHRAISVSELEDHVYGRKAIQGNAFLVTFDDGYQDIIDTVPYFSSKNIKPVVFIISDRAMANRIELDTDRAFLSHEQIQRLMSTGWTIGSHSATHADFLKLSGEDMNKEILTSKKELEKEFSMLVNHFCYPKGVYSRDIVNKVKESGYTLGFSMDDGEIVSGMSPFCIPRVGVDGTHSLVQFPVLYHPVSKWIRRIIKRLI